MSQNTTGYISSISVLLINEYAPMTTITTLLSILTPIVIMIYHLSKMYFDVIRPNYGGSWWKYLKSIPNYFTKRRK